MKKSLKALLLAMVLVAMPVAVFAAGSTDTSSSSSRPASSSGSSSGGGGGGGGSSSSSSSTSSSVYVAGGPGSTTGSTSTTTSGGVVETTHTTITTGTGNTYDAGVVYYDPVTGFTLALVAEHTSDEKEANNEGTTYVTSGVAKRAGLPENVIAGLDLADTGDLSGIYGVDTSAKETLGWTLAARNEAGGPASIYCSGITAENAARIIILCYNNWTQLYSYLTPTSVDVENQIAHCQIPTSCTLQLIIQDE